MIFITNDLEKIKINTIFAQPYKRIVFEARLKHKDVEAEELEKKRLPDACSAVQTTTIERNSSKYRVDAKRMYREYTR